VSAHNQSLPLDPMPVGGGGGGGVLSPKPNCNKDKSHPMGQITS
jgi:hypothetical protein